MLEPSCCKKRQKSLNQETGMENREPLETEWYLMIKRVINGHLGLIWYLSEPSGAPYSPNKILVGTSFAYSKPALHLILSMAGYISSELFIQ